MNTFNIKLSCKIIKKFIKHQREFDEKFYRFELKHNFEKELKKEESPI